MLRRSRERGSAPVELALGVAVLLFPAALVVLSFGPWLEARTFVRSGAAVVARQIAVTGSESSVAQGLAAMAGSAGIEVDSVAVQLCSGSPVTLGAANPSGCLPLPRAGAVTVTVLVAVPVVSTPWGEIGGLTVEATHSESLDLYRSMP